MSAAPFRLGSVEELLLPLDAVRRAVLRAGGGVARRLVVERELRVAVAGASIVVAGLAATLLAPLWLLALSPIVWGVPHLLADLRYLVIRPGLHRRASLWLAAGVPLAGAAAGLGSKYGFIATAGALLVARGALGWRIAGMVVAASLAAVAWQVGYLADLVMAHAHNFIAVFLWWAWRPRVSRRHWIPLALFAAATALLLLGPLDALLSSTHALVLSPAGLDLDDHIHRLAPGVPDALAIRLVLCFAFAQAVHYGTWTRLIPDEDRARRTVRSFAASLRALRADFGTWPLLIATAVFLAIAGWATFDLAAARDGYFRLAMFHGHLELVAAALFLVEGRRWGTLGGDVRSSR